MGMLFNHHEAHMYTVCSYYIHWALVYCIAGYFVSQIFNLEIYADLILTHVLVASKLGIAQ